MKTFLLFLLIIIFPLSITYADNVTPVFISLSALTSGTIPITAKGWTITIIRGNATIGSQFVKAGFSDLDHNQPLEPIIITTGTSSSAYIRYNQ